MKKQYMLLSLIASVCIRAAEDNAHLEKLTAAQEAISRTREIPYPETRSLIASYIAPWPFLHAQSMECLQTLTGHRDSVRSATFNHEGTLLASASDDGTIKLWDIATWQELHTLVGHTGRATSVTFNCDGTLITASADGTKIWDPASGQELRALATGHRGHISWVHSVNHDVTLLASVSTDGAIGLWDIASGQELLALEQHIGEVISISFNHDSTLLASVSGDGIIKLWDIASGREIRRLEGYRSRVQSATFSHDSTLLVFALADGTIKICNTTTREELRTLKGHTHGVNSAIFNYDSTLLASTSHDKTVKIWGIRPEKLSALDRLKQTITMAQANFLHSLATCVGERGLLSKNTKIPKIRDAQSKEIVRSIKRDHPLIYQTIRPLFKKSREE